MGPVWKTESRSSKLFSTLVLPQFSTLSYLHKINLYCKNTVIYTIIFPNIQISITCTYFCKLSPWTWSSFLPAHPFCYSDVKTREMLFSFHGDFFLPAVIYYFFQVFSKGLSMERKNSQRQIKYTKEENRKKKNTWKTAVKRERKAKRITVQGRYNWKIET